MNELRKKEKFMLLEVPPGIWKALDDETLARRGPKGRLEIREVAIELLEECLKELGYDEFIQFRKLHSFASNLNSKESEK